MQGKFTICSWDVGIKNLAYCVIEKTNVIKIVDWNIINLVEHKTTIVVYIKKIM